MSDPARMTNLLRKELEARITDLEAEVSNARVQSLENEKEIVTLKLQVQELTEQVRNLPRSLGLPGLPPEGSEEY